MRWTRWQYGDERTRTFIALLPRALDPSPIGGAQWVWLERVTVRERYSKGWRYDYWETLSCTLTSLSGL
jgi:hypothetical protein